MVFEYIPGSMACLAKCCENVECRCMLFNENTQMCSIAKKNYQSPITTNVRGGTVAFIRLGMCYS